MAGTLLLYTRRGCCLCDRLASLVQPAVERRSIPLQFRNVEEQEHWRQWFGDRVPVLTYEGRVLLEGRPSEVEVAAALETLP